MDDRRINPIKHAREATGMTQKQLAEATGLNHRTIQKLENWERDILSMQVRNLLELAKALEVEPWVLLMGSDEIADEQG